MKFVFDECISFRIPGALKALGVDADAYSAHWQRGEKDVVWIPAAGNAGWCVVTSDALRKPQEREALRRNNGRIILLAIKHLRFWDQVRLVINRWETVERVASKESPPFIYRFTSKSAQEQWVSV